MHMIRQRPRRKIAVFLIISFLSPQQGGQLPLRTDLIPAGRWVFDVSSGGSRLGELTSTIRTDNDRIISTSDLRGLRIQRGSLTAQLGTLIPIESSTFIYQPGEGSTSARITYTVEEDSLFVSGSVIWSGVGQPRSTPMMIRQRLPLEGAFDNQSVDLLISALPLESGGSWSANLFDPTHDRPIRIVITVTGRITVSTPAGTFEAWKVEVDGMAGKIEYMIECTSRVLVAQYLPAQDLRLELKSPLRPKL